MTDLMVLFFGGGGVAPPGLLERFVAERELSLMPAATAEDVLHQVNRAMPAALVLDVHRHPEAVLDLCRRIKADPFLAVVPVAIVVPDPPGDLTARALESGADEVIGQAVPEREVELRLDLLLHRALRDVSVHPTTRLPGTPQIDRDLKARMRDGAPFAFCYADLDHFKEFNDRYGYARGDRVIYLVSLILRDIVRGLSPGGFLGHIGGDDFIFTVPMDSMEAVCDGVIDLFDELIPFQYSPADRAAGYFLGRDRRGTLHRIPLMTLSVGVVTNETRSYRHSSEMTARAGEMKTYAKTLPGSVYVVDRRHPLVPPEAASLPARELAVDADSSTGHPVPVTSPGTPTDR